MIDSKAVADFNDIYPSFNSYNPPAKYSKMEKVDRFCIGKKNDNFAMGWVGHISAPNWYARKENGKWIMEMVTQDYPLCDRIEGFPLDYFGGKCLYMDDDDKTQIKDLN